PFAACLIRGLFWAAGVGAFTGDASDAAVVAFEGVGCSTTTIGRKGAGLVDTPEDPAPTPARPATPNAGNPADGLGARANEIHGALDPIAQNSRTTAVMSTREGTTVIASGGRDLSPAQRALVGPEDVLGKLPGAHAEVTAMDAAAKAGLTPAEIAASRPICPACQAAITESGGQVSPSGWWAWWPR
ncbi:MAG: hypothetical protein WBD02_10220, partial [Acidimicrobiia bacterium]